MSAAPHIPGIGRLPDRGLGEGAMLRSRDDCIKAEWIGASL